METYCIFCKNGSEQKIINQINKNYTGLTALAPVRIVNEKTGNKWTQKEKHLLPGYIFIYSEISNDIKFLLKSNDIYKVLQYENGVRTLQGQDMEYAMWIYNNHGRIIPSHVFEDGDKIRVVDGPLAEFNGQIIRIEKRKRRALVEFDFDGHKRSVSLSVEFITKDSLNSENMEQK